MKRITSIILSIVLVSSLYIFQGVGFAAEQQDLNGFIGLKIDCSKAIVNGSVTQLVDNDTQYSPFGSDGRTYVPVRFVVQTFGGKVDWDNSTKEAAITVGNYKVVFKDGSNKFTANGETKTMDVKPTYRNGKMYIPVRFLVESIGKIVSYKDGYILLGDRAATDEDYANLKSKLGGTPVSNEPVVGVDVGITNTEKLGGGTLVEYDNKIYYIDDSNEGKGSVHEADIDLKNDKIIISFSRFEAHCLNLFQGKLYYCTKEGLYCFDLITKTTKICINTPVIEVLVTKYGIFYIQSSTNDFYTGKSLWYMSLDGTNNKKIIDAKGCLNLQYYGELIYYSTGTINDRYFYGYNVSTKHIESIIPGLKGEKYWFLVADSKFFIIGGHKTYNGKDYFEGDILYKDLKTNEYNSFSFEGNNNLYFTSSGKYAVISKQTDIYQTDFPVYLYKVDEEHNYELIKELNGCHIYFGTNKFAYAFKFTERQGSLSVSQIELK